MDRSPINESHDDVSPPSSGRPADERSLTPPDATDPTPTEASPFTPTESVADRPAGQISVPADAVIPPPPPPPSHAVPSRSPRPSGFGDAPPTAIWSQPPVAANPPRPTAMAPPLGPPNSPPPALSDGPLPLGPKRRGWRVAVGVVAVCVMALSLVAGGFALGSVLTDSDESANITVASPLLPVDGPSDDAASDVLDVVPGPLTDEDSDEPVADVARAVSPSVVLIQTTLGQGSGIVWNAAEGYIVTNDHVVGDASIVEVQFANGAQLPGTVIGSDPARDIAVIQVDSSRITLVEAVFAPTSTVEVGQLAVAIGSPFGLEQTVTAGIVSAVNRINEFGGSDPTTPIPVEMIQTDAPINPGNSGGALADRQGRVIGMNTQIRTSGNSDGNIGVGFAVPSDTIVLIAQRILAGESLDLAFLGISGESPVDGSVGALILSVVAESPAAIGGLETGDLIVSLDGEVVSSMAELAAEIKLFRPDEVVELELLRDGVRLVSEVTLGSP